MSFSAALPPWLREAVEEAGDATVILKAGDRPYVIKSKAPYHLGTQPLTNLALEALAQQILSEDAQNALYNGENVQETLTGAGVPVTVRAVRMDHDIVIRLRHAQTDQPPPQVETTDQTAPGAATENRAGEAAGQPDAVGSEPAEEPAPTSVSVEPAPADAPPPSPPFLIEDAGGTVVAQSGGRQSAEEIEIPTSAEAVDTYISALGPATPPATRDEPVPSASQPSREAPVAAFGGGEDAIGPAAYQEAWPPADAAEGQYRSLGFSPSAAEEHADPVASAIDQYLERHEQHGNTGSPDRENLAADTRPRPDWDIAEQPDPYAPALPEPGFSDQSERYVPPPRDTLLTSRHDPYRPEPPGMYATKRREPALRQQSDTYDTLQRDIFLATQRASYVTEHHGSQLTRSRETHAGYPEEPSSLPAHPVVEEPAPLPADAIGTRRTEQLDEQDRTGVTNSKALAVTRRRPVLSATADLDDWIIDAMDRGATALYLRAGSPPAARIDGHLDLLASEPLPMSMFERAGSVMTAGQDGWRDAGEWAWTKDIPGAGTVRCQVFSDTQGGGLIVRLPVPVSGLDRQVPRHIRTACDAGEGLIVVSAPFFDDVAAMVKAVVAWSARRRTGFVVAFGFDDGLQSAAGDAFVSARPMPATRDEMVTTLHAALHERPDTLVVIAEGDLPPADAIVSAAVGRLVIVGVVARTASRALEVILKDVTGDRRTLASVFRAACSWRGFRRPDAQRVVVSDALVATERVCALIDSGEISGLHQAQASGHDGMRAIDAALAVAVTRRKITLREAAACAVDRKSLVVLVRQRTRELRAAARAGQGTSQRALPGA